MLAVEASKTKRGIPVSPKSRKLLAEFIKHVKRNNEQERREREAAVHAGLLAFEAEQKAMRIDVYSRKLAEWTKKETKKNVQARVREENRRKDRQSDDQRRQIDLRRPVDDLRPRAPSPSPCLQHRSRRRGRRRS